MELARVLVYVQGTQFSMYGFMLRSSGDKAVALLQDRVCVITRAHEGCDWTVGSAEECLLDLAGVL